MSKLTTVGKLRKGALFLDIWGNQWKKATSKHDYVVMADNGSQQVEFPHNFSCYTCSREEALEDLKDRVDTGDTNTPFWESRLKAMQEDPYTILRAELNRLVLSTGMIYNGRSVDLERGLRNILRSMPPLPPRAS